MDTESSSRQCSVKWYHKCYMCSAPLNFVAVVPEDKLESFYTYSQFKRIDFTGNVALKKIVGLNLREVCLRCYIYKKCNLIPGPKQLRTRECTGKTDMFKSDRQPLSEDEVYRWFESFLEFSERPDVEEYLVKTRRYAISGLTIIVWPLRSYINLL